MIRELSSTTESSTRATARCAGRHAGSRVVGMRTRLLCLGCIAATAALASCGRDATPPSASQPTPKSERAPQSAPEAAAAPATAQAAVPTVSSSARTARSADGTYEVSWEPVGGAIPEADPFSIAFEVRRTDGSPLEGACVVRVDAEMPHHGHGMNLVPTVRREGDAARFVADGMLFHMPGRWVLAIDVEESGLSERTQWYVDIE